MQRVTRGSALVGKLYGTIVADAGSITSTEIAAKGVSAANLALANTKIPIGSTAGGGVAYALTGDVTMSNGGVTAIGAKKVLATMTAIANTKVLVGSTGGVGVAYALSGDVTMDNLGAVTIGNKKVTPIKMGLANTKIAIGGTTGAGAEYALGGDVTMTNAGAVTIGTSKVTAGKIGAGAVTNAKIGDKAVYGAKIKAEWSALSNTTKSVSSVKINAVNTGYFITQVGTSKGIVISSTAGVLSNPTAGDWLKLTVAATPSTIPIHVKSTNAAFAALSTLKFALLNAVGDSVVLEALSTARWIAVYNTGVTFVAST